MMKLTPRVQKLGVEISKPSWMDLRNAVKSPALVGVLSAGRGEPRKPAKLAFVSRPPFIELPTAVQGNEGKTPIFSVPVTSCFCLAKSCVTRFSFALKAHPLAQSLPLVRLSFVSPGIKRPGIRVPHLCSNETVSDHRFLLCLARVCCTRPSGSREARRL